MNKLEKMLNDYPEILQPKLEMKSSNEEIVFHEGLFKLKWKELFIELKGRIIFKWLPDLAVKVYGNFLENTFDTSIIEPFETNLIFELEVPEKQFYAKGIIQNISTESDNYNIVGYLKPPITFGDLTKKVKEVYFEIPNLRDFHGTAVRKDTGAYKNRLILKGKEYKITLDKHYNYGELSRDLAQKGGFVLLYSGKLESLLKNEMTYEESADILDCLSFFLHFINGRRTSPIFRYGFHGTNEQWKSITPYLVDNYKYVMTWPQKFQVEGISETWLKFSELWKNESDRDCITTVLHWYVEANSNAAFIEGSIVLIQNALELLFHWLIAEKKNYVNSSDADNLSASAKIGFLLSNYNIDANIPNELKELINFAKQYSITNGPDSFIRLRNCIVHPSRKKRKTLQEIEDKAKVEALNLGIWYVEMILLKHLEFKGSIQNRFAIFSRIDTPVKV